MSGNQDEFPPLGRGWVGSSHNRICGWGFGYIHKSTVSPVGFTMHLNSLTLLNEIKVTIYEINDTPFEFHPEKLKQVKAYSLKRDALLLYADSQEVYLPIGNINFVKDQKYLVTVEGDNFLGCASSRNDLQKENYFSRGYFKKLGATVYHPVASNHSIARRLVFLEDMQPHMSLNASCLPVNGNRQKMEDFYLNLHVKTGERRYLLEYAKTLIRFLNKEKALPVLENICIKYPDYTDAWLLAVEAHIIFNMPAQALIMLKQIARQPDNSLLSFLSWGQLYGRARQFKEAGKPELALNYCKLGFSFWPDNKEIWSLYFSLLLSLHKWNSLLDASRSVADRKSSDEKALLGISIANWNLGRKEIAHDYLARLAALPHINEDIALALTKRDYCLINEEAALNIIEKALKKSPENLEIAGTYYRLCTKKGNSIESAQRMLENIAEAHKAGKLTSYAVYDAIKLFDELKTRNIAANDCKWRFINQIANPESGRSAKLCLYGLYIYMPHVAPILAHMPSDSVDLVFDKPSVELTEYLRKSGLDRFKVFYGYENCLRYDMIWGEHAACCKYTDKRTITFSHGTDSWFPPSVCNQLSAVIYQYETVAANGTVLLTNKDKALKAQLPAESITEIAYTGPFHTDTELFNLSKQEIRKKIAEEYNIFLPPEKPVIFFLTDELCLPSHIAYCVSKLSEYCTVIFKPWFIYPPYGKLPESVITFQNPQMNNNLLRLGADFIFCSFTSGTLMSSVMLGLPIIPYYSRAVKIQNYGYEATIPQPIETWIDKHEMYDEYKNISKSIPKYKLMKEFADRNFLFDLLKTSQIKKAITEKDFLQKYNEQLPEIQKKVYGNYMKKGSARKTAELILRMARTGTFGEDCYAIHIKNPAHENLKWEVDFPDMPD